MWLNMTGGKKKHTVTHFGLVKSPWVSVALAWRVWFQLAMARCSPQKQALKFRVFEWMKYITVLYIILNQDNAMLMKINCPSQFYSFWCFPKAAPHAKAWSGFGCSPRIFRTSACSPENKINLNQEDGIESKPKQLQLSMFSGKTTNGTWSLRQYSNTKQWIRVVEIGWDCGMFCFSESMSPICSVRFWKAYFLHMMI